jgi:two-component system CheB/CheR fusion protein
MNILEQRNREAKRPKPGKRALPDARLGSQDCLMVVGIGSSAGGPVALQNFFKALRADTEMAFVVTTHRDPQKESLLPGLLQKWTAMPVQAVTQRVPIEPDHVYVIAPNQRVLWAEDKARGRYIGVGSV